MKYQRYRGCSPSGLTLVEVLASMVLISTLLVSSLHSLQKHIEQNERSQLKSNAVLAADRLLSGWFSNGSTSVPITASGTTSYVDRFRWKTDVVSRSSDLPGVVVVRLELFAKDLDDFVAPIVSVDVAAKAATPGG